MYTCKISGLLLKSVLASWLSNCHFPSFTLPDIVQSSSDFCQKQRIHSSWNKGKFIPVALWPEEPVSLTRCEKNKFLQDWMVRVSQDQPCTPQNLSFSNIWHRKLLCPNHHAGSFYMILDSRSNNVIGVQYITSWVLINSSDSLLFSVSIFHECHHTAGYKVRFIRSYWALVGQLFLWLREQLSKNTTAGLFDLPNKSKLWLMNQRFGARQTF